MIEEAMDNNENLPSSPKIIKVTKEFKWGDIADYTTVKPMTKKERRQAYLEDQQKKLAASANLGAEKENENFQKSPLNLVNSQNVSVSEGCQNFQVSKFSQPLINQSELLESQAPVTPSIANENGRFLDQSEDMEEDFHLPNQNSENFLPTNQII